MSVRKPFLVSLYRRYLHDENSAAFIKAVSEHYTTATLERLAASGPRVVRRAAVLALSFLGDYKSNAALGRALRDRDRCVRLLAENGIRQLWCRDGSPAQQDALRIIIRLNGWQQYEQACERAGELIRQAPWFAEAWNQRAIAHFHLGRYDQSARDCFQALELNPYHFGAAVGLAHCHLEMNDAVAALKSFRRALRLNPDMEAVRIQVYYLERSLEGS